MHLLVQERKRMARIQPWGVSVIPLKDMETAVYGYSLQASGSDGPVAVTDDFSCSSCNCNTNTCDPREPIEKKLPFFDFNDIVAAEEKCYTFSRHTDDQMNAAMDGNLLMDFVVCGENQQKALSNVPLHLTMLQAFGTKNPYHIPLMNS